MGVGCVSALPLSSADNIYLNLPYFGYHKPHTIIAYDLSREGMLLVYSPLFLPSFFGIPFTGLKKLHKKKKKEGHSELKEVLAQIKKMDELYKKREKKHLEL